MTWHKNPLQHEHGSGTKLLTKFCDLSSSLKKKTARLCQLVSNCPQAGINFTRSKSEFTLRWNKRQEFRFMNFFMNIFNFHKIGVTKNFLLCQRNHWQDSESESNFFDWQTHAPVTRPGPRPYKRSRFANGVQLKVGVIKLTLLFLLKILTDRIQRIEMVLGESSIDSFLISHQFSPWCSSQDLQDP